VPWCSFGLDLQVTGREVTPAPAAARSAPACVVASWRALVFALELGADTLQVLARAARCAVATTASPAGVSEAGAALCRHPDAELVLELPDFLLSAATYKDFCRVRTLSPWSTMAQR
jgi:hypothetical protein